MKKENPGFTRRDFVKSSVLTGMGAIITTRTGLAFSRVTAPVKPATNIADALKYPRNGRSLPGLFPGKVTEVFHAGSVSGRNISMEAVNEMLTRGMLELTGTRKIEKA